MVVGQEVLFGPQEPAKMDVFVQRKDRVVESDLGERKDRRLESKNFAQTLVYRALAKT